MRIYDLIAKKRDGGTHSREELEAIVNGFVSGEVADYQMAAWMMAVYLRGMNTGSCSSGSRLYSASPVSLIRCENGAAVANGSLSVLT